MEASSSTAVKPAIGIISIGDMGMGVAKLLKAHEYQVYTRSKHTKDRIKAAQIIDLEVDEALVVECDIILSIVPPRDAIATARRIHTAAGNVARARHDRKGSSDLLYADLNAVSPRTVRKINDILTPDPTSPQPPPSSSTSITRRLSRTLSMGSSATEPRNPPPKPVTVHFLDGGIIGGPPQQKPDKSWKVPSIVVSGDTSQAHLTDHLQSVLNMKIVSDKIGAASTLKACFAAFGKGIYAVAIASYTTAHTAGLLPELQTQLAQVFPTIKEFVEKGMPSVPPKAYRWVDEMKQIGETLADQGRLGNEHGAQAMFGGISDIYRTIADDTVLGKELVHKRKRGTTAEDVAEAVRQGLEEKRQKNDKDPKLELAWRSSWGL